MIRQIRGKVLSVEPTGAVIDIAGFGVFVHLAVPAVIPVGKEVVLHTHFAVSQNGADLYGFADAEDLTFFGLIINVPGVGPKTALSILRRAPREALGNAIAKRDLNYLTRVVGLGKKTAEKMLVELSDKTALNGSENGEDGEVFDTLVALGYTEREARKALTSVPSTITGKDARLKAALSHPATK